MIPKVINYFWFGDAIQPPVVKKCVASWKKQLPDYTITIWNEHNYAVNKSKFTQKAFAEKKWAFLSDYARLDILYQYGGLYLDTDMEMLRPLDNFLKHGLFLGMESDTHVNASIMGAQPRHWLLREILDEYDQIEEYETIPVVVTRVLERYITIENKLNSYTDIAIYPTEYFYPFPFGGRFSKKLITNNTYAIHWWDHSWGSPVARLAKKFGIIKPLVALKNKLSGL